MSDQEKHDWDRLTGESSKAYAAFCTYRDLGPERSIVKAIKGSGNSAANLRQWEYWSSKHSWVDRAAAYDDHSERQRLAQLQKKRREMDARHAKIGILSQNLAVRGIEKLLAKVQSDQQNLGPSELARLVEVGVKVERLAMGESTDIQQAVGPGGGPVQIEHAFIRAVRRALGFNDPPDEV